MRMLISVINCSQTWLKYVKTAVTWDADMDCFALVRLRQDEGNLFWI